jgi:hypothetical protein
MTMPAARAEKPLPAGVAGLLRSLVLFHEPRLLGAGTSVLNVVAPLREYGWSLLGWIPGEGFVRCVADERLDAVVCAERFDEVSPHGAWEGIVVTRLCLLCARA